MNHFLALRPQDEVGARLAQLCERLRDWGLPATWVHPADYHITLAFLGAFDAEAAGLVQRRVAEVGAALTRCDGLSLPGLAAMAGRRQPRLCYAAVADPAGWCADLHLDLADALDRRPDRAFVPHITLCRPRPARAGEASSQRSWPELLAAFGQAELGPCPLLDLAHLVADPSSAGSARYRVLANWPLPD